MAHNKNTPLLLGGLASICAAFAHILVILGGPDWYRAFGAGEELATMAEQGLWTPSIITLAIATILIGWGLYAFSGAGYIRKLPLLKTCLVLITAVYCVRGTYGFFLPFISDHPDVQSMSISFWFISSGICLTIGLLYLSGLKTNWPNLVNH